MEDNFLSTYKNFVLFKAINDTEHKLIDVYMNEDQFKDKYKTKYYEGYKYGMMITYQNHNISLEKKFISVAQGSGTSIGCIYFINYEDYQEFIQAAYHNGIIDGILAFYFNDDIESLESQLSKIPDINADFINYSKKKR